MRQVSTPEIKRKVYSKTDLENFYGILEKKLCIKMLSQ